MEQATGSNWQTFFIDVIARLIKMSHAKLEEDNFEYLVKLEVLLPAITNILGSATFKMHRGPLKDLQDLIYAVDDVLDDYEYTLLETRVRNGENRNRENKEPSPRSLSRFFQCFNFSGKINSEADHYDVQELLRECITKVLAAAERCGALSNHAGEQYSQNESRTHRKNTITLTRETTLFGRDAEVQHVMESIDDDPHYRLGVGTFTAVGISGVGKSALARIIFNNEIIKQEFPVRIWIYVSEQFDVKALMLQMIQEATGGKELTFDSNSSLDSIQNAIKDLLKEKRFLLVLDDVTGVSMNQWKDLQKVVKSAARRSLIFVTTQSMIIAERVSTTKPLEIPRFLDKSMSELLKNCALEENQQGVYEAKSPLVISGEAIASKLDGLPLSAMVLGRALHHRREDSHWRQILDNTQWKQSEDGIPAALWLSYQHLNPILKQCFVYCAVFPPNYVLEKKRLVQMWGAQGLIPTNDTERLEDVGMDIFLELTDRGFFRSAGNGGRYVMHTLIRELAQHVSYSNCFTITDNSEQVPRDVRHLTIKTGNLMKIKADLNLVSAASNNQILNQLRTLLFYGDCENNTAFADMIIHLFSHLRSIRVLKLPCQCTLEVLRSTGQLKHLRYLDLSGNRINELPGSICHLYHMNVLDLRQCSDFSPPRNLVNLINLRHLYASSHTLSTIPSIQSFTNLQDMEVFQANSASGIEALQGIPQLQGAMQIHNLHYVKYGRTRRGILKETAGLKKVSLSWSSGGQNSPSPAMRDFNMSGELLECLQPHENLKELEITGFPGKGSPSWMLQIDNLKNTKYISLSNCSHWEVLPALHLLPNLESLEIKQMQSIQQIYSLDRDRELNGASFLQLKTLVLSDLPLCSGWETNGEVLFPRLHKLELINCPLITMFPPIPLSLEALTIENVGLEALPMIREESDGSSKEVSSLSRLYVSNCNNLEYLSTGLFQQQNLLGSLHAVKLRNCNKLKSGLEHGFKDLSALADLSICDCPELLISEFPESLSTLEISECFIQQGPWHEVFPHLFSVFDSKISGCSHVGSDDNIDEKLDWMDTLYNVQVLEVARTSVLTLNTFDRLRNLKFLEIDGCQAFFDTKAQPKSYTTLAHLSIQNCNDLAFFPAGPGIFPSLEELCLENCPLINDLPNIGFLSQLKRLSINRCNPLLGERCRVGYFERENTSSLECVYIDGECLQQ